MAWKKEGVVDLRTEDHVEGQQVLALKSTDSGAKMHELESQIHHL